ncbi:O-antigen ligase family protein [candidate division WOR-3 bacterium]|nr:O-antigen ligase family protein [candidate division WOR-3 bacterium]
MLVFFLAPLVSKNRHLSSGGIFTSAVLAVAIFVIISYFRKIDNIPLSLPFLITFTIFSAFSAVFSEEKELSTVQVSYFFSWSAAFFCGYAFREKRDLFYRIAVFSASAALIYSLWQYFVIFPAIKDMLASGSGLVETSSELISAGRIFSTFQYPNSFAAYLLLVSGLIWILLEKNDSGSILKAFLCVVWFSVSFFIYLTSSRLALALWALFIVGTAIYFYKKNKKMLFLITVLALAGTSTAVIINRSNEEPATREIHERAHSLKTDSGSKLLTFYGAVNMTLDNPFTGSGPGMFKRQYPRYRPVGQTDVPSSAHNIILDVSSTAGIPASLFLAAALFFILADSLSFPLLFFTFLSLLLHSLGDWDFNNFGISIVFFTLAGAHSKPCALKKPKLFSLALALSFPFFIFFSMRSGIAGRFYERGDFLLRFGHPESAVFYSDRAIQINPSRADYFFLKGLSFRDPDSAENAFLEASARSPLWFEPYYHLGKINMASGDCISARRYFETAYGLFPSSVEIKSLLDSLESQGR